MRKLAVGLAVIGSRSMHPPIVSPRRIHAAGGRVVLGSEAQTGVKGHEHPPSGWMRPEDLQTSHCVCNSILEAGDVSVDLRFVCRPQRHAHVGAGAYAPFDQMPTHSRSRALTGEPTEKVMARKSYQATGLRLILTPGFLHLPQAVRRESDAKIS